MGWQANGGGAGSDSFDTLLIGVETASDLIGGDELEDDEFEAGDALAPPQFADA